MQHRHLLLLFSGTLAHNSAALPGVSPSVTAPLSAGTQAVGTVSQGPEYSAGFQTPKYALGNETNYNPTGASTGIKSMATGETSASENDGEDSCSLEHLDNRGTTDVKRDSDVKRGDSKGKGKQKDCGDGGRGRGGKGAGKANKDPGPGNIGLGNALDPRHITEITKSNSVKHTITATCSCGRYPQACANYYSAFENNEDWLPKTYMCTDDNNRNNAWATHSWGSQHNPKWRSYTSLKADGQPPNCQADEFPPAYFMPPFSGLHGRKQIIRWIPGHENSGAANTEWSGLCNKHDGGKFNGQTIGNKNNGGLGRINMDLVNLIGHGHEVVNGGTTTTSFEADFSRAVFTMAFDHKWPDKKTPSVQNDWLLRDNPCWPKAIVPDDPGFVLLTDDHWYNTAAPKSVSQAAKGEVYKNDPERRIIEEAEKRLGAKRQHSPDDSGPAKKGSGGGGKGSGSGKKGLWKRANLEMIDGGGLAIRDTNSSRRLTDQEMKREIQVITCASSDCQKELAEMGNFEGGALVVSGKPTLTEPRANLDVLSTPQATTVITKADKRSPASPELPAATHVPVY